MPSKLHVTLTPFLYNSIKNVHIGNLNEAAMRFKILLVILFLPFFYSSCTYKSIEVDLIVHNATVYTVNDVFEKVEAFAVKDGKIIELGAERAILNKYTSSTIVNAENKFIYPGFIDAHCHFLYYGMGLQNVDLVGTKSFEEIIEKVVAFAEKNPEGPIIGRGWDQNDWGQLNFPTNSELNELFPNRAVMLRRIDGHASLVNDVVLKESNIVAGQEISGGLVEVRDGKLTGILVDNAIDLVEEAIPLSSDEMVEKALLQAQKDCFELGLTTVDDAGLNKRQIDLISKMQNEGSMKMRIYAMISDDKEDLEFYFKNGPIKTDRLNVRSVKVYADGALGSRGASLLAPYSDKPEEWGFLLNSFDHFDSLAAACYANGFQMNTHCIGDSANRYLSDLYSEYLGGTNDLRWRIEHAQIVHDSDIEKFQNFSIIPSIQPTHATSDMYWAEERLGAERIHEAYPYQKLLKANGLVALGTDFPVEKVDPRLTFYAAVSRKDVEGFPEGSFLPDQKLSRKEALMGMTIWAAIANFEEEEKGSLENQKFADFIILDQDIMKIDESRIPDVNILATYVNGEEVFRK